MEDTVFVTPKKGFKIRDPHGKDHIPNDGRLVVLSPYWTRLINDGDVTVSPAPKAASAQSAPAAKS